MPKSLINGSCCEIKFTSLSNQRASLEKGTLFYIEDIEETTDLTSPIKYCNEEYLNTGNLLKSLFSNDAVNLLR